MHGVGGRVSALRCHFKDLAIPRCGLLVRVRLLLQAPSVFDGGVLAGCLFLIHFKFPSVPSASLGFLFFSPPPLISTSSHQLSHLPHCVPFLLSLPYSIYIPFPFRLHYLFPHWPCSHPFCPPQEGALGAAAAPGTGLAARLYLGLPGNPTPAGGRKDAPGEEPHTSIAW